MCVMRGGFFSAFDACMCCVCVWTCVLGEGVNGVRMMHVCSVRCVWMCVLGEGVNWVHMMHACYVCLCGCVRCGRG